MYSIQLKRSTSADADFQDLVIQLDQDLAEKNGDNNAFFAQYNRIDFIQHVVVLYVNDKAVACGAFKAFDDEQVEIKRMFVCEDQRGKKLGLAVLQELERWAIELRYTSCVLETGTKMKAAIHLYTKFGFERIENYGQYAGIEDSLCFRKKLG